MPASRDQIENAVLPAFLGYCGRYEGFGFWAAAEKATGELLGWFHFRPRRDAVPGGVGLGHRLRKSAWDKGFATEGSHALICKGFTEFGVQRVVAEAMAVNMASRPVMEEAALRLVRIFYQPWPYPIEGDQFGVVEYALDKAGWQQDQVGASGCPLAEGHRGGIAHARLSSRACSNLVISGQIPAVMVSAAPIPIGRQSSQMSAFAWQRRSRGLHRSVQRLDRCDRHQIHARHGRVADQA